MKCWRCGLNNDKDAANCAFCGIEMTRYKAETEVGNAMQKLYDQYGGKRIFAEKRLLVNGLLDMKPAGYTQVLKDNLSNAYDAGIGKLYLNQLDKGIPDSGFYDNAIVLLENAGFTKESGMQIIRYFEEMIGWRPLETKMDTDRIPHDKEKLTPSAVKANIEKPSAYFEHLTRNEEKPKKKTGLIIGLIVGILVAVNILLVILRIYYY